jgi:hypothetical protein
MPLSKQTAGKGKRAKKKSPRAAAARPRRRRPSVRKGSASVEISLPAAGTLGRTRRLLLAALRLWELKRGIRD